jgi:EmrB/QacA subfamily drug resistance transporter
VEHALHTVDEAAYERRWAILGVLCLSLFMVIVGNTVLNLALPTLVRDLHATNTQLQWIVDAYALVFAGLLLTGGALGDRYGRKGLLQIGLVLFGTGSALSTVATSPNQLIATRALMGLAAALVMPATLSILAYVFPPQERGRAIGVWAGVAGAGAAIGPIASGILLEHFWWGSIFFVNIPVVVTALVLGYLIVPTSRDPNNTPLDPVGAVISVGALGSLLYAIIEAPRRGWTEAGTLAAFILAVVLFALFIYWESQTEHPMLNLSFFQHPGFTGGAIAITLVFFTMFGSFFLLTQYLQLVKGYSPLGAGVRTLPMAMTMMVAAPTSARFVERYGSRRVVTAGLTIVAIGMAVMSRSGVDTSYWYIALALVILAIGMANTMAPSTGAIMTSLPMSKAGVGSAVNDTTRELGGSLGVAVLGSLMASRYSTALHHRAVAVPKAVLAAADDSLGAALGIARSLGGARGAQLAAAARSAFVDATHVTLLVGAGVAAVGAYLIFRILPSNLGRLERVEHLDEGREPVTASAR